MISAPLLSCFQDHAAKLRDRARAKREAVALKHVVDDPDVREEATDDANLGRRLPGERFAGDTALRTLNTLLAMVDARGFERSAHQIRFHSSMIRCVVRVLYRADWATQAPVIMERNGWDRCPSEVLVSTPRRFGKTFSIAILSACLALACKFLCLLGARDRITEYNQEVCRVNSYDGGSSLIRSFPSAVGYVEPLQSVLSRLLELGSKSVSFGRCLARIFEDEMEASEAQIADSCEEAPPKAEPPRERASERGAPSHTRRAWVRRVLSEERGVAAALPSAGADASRVLQLAGTEVGAAAWWLDRLRGTAFSPDDSYEARRGTAVYRLAGGPDDGGWGWFPTGAAYALPKGAVGQYIALGLTVELDATPPAAYASGGTREPPHEVVNQLSDHAALRLDAASVGVAPAVLACVIAHAAGDSRPRGLVVASQLHTFRLRDLLLARQHMAEWENVAYADAQLQRAGAETAALLRRLGDARLLCLHPTTEHVVFVPELGGQSEVWHLGGVGLRTAAHDLIEGVPRLTGFDARLCHRIDAAQADYNADAAWLLHGALLLGAARLEFDEPVVLALRAGFEEAGWMRALGEARPAPEFGALLGREFRHGRHERDPVPDRILASLDGEFEALVETGSESRRFRLLLDHLLGPTPAAPPRVDDATRSALSRAAAARRAKRSAAAL